MSKYFVPFLLAAVGFVMVTLTQLMPLLDWEIDVETVGFSHSCEFDMPSHCSTRLGESLRNKRTVLDLITPWYFSYQSTDVVVELSPSDASVNRFWSRTSQKLSISLVCLETLVTLAALGYVPYMAHYSEGRSCLGVIWIGLIGMGVCLASGILLTAFAPVTSAPPLFWEEGYCTGSLFVRASLLRLHWETIAVLIMGLMLQTLAAVLVVRGLLKAHGLLHSFRMEP
jgi:hypothetical protein